MARSAGARRRLGRPPASESAETRERIIRAARDCFGRYGYDKTSNQVIARRAGITSGAIYHYFESKQDLFRAVAIETQATVLQRFRAALRDDMTVVEKVGSLLDAAVALHREDSSMARFVSTSPMEISRHEDFQDLATGPLLETLRFFEEIAREGRERGEVAPDVTDAAVADMLMATTTGIALFGGFVEDLSAHAETTAAFRRLVEGTLLRARTS
ncbi:MAG: TetR/AcrR family transcriptional regulator [Acidimicrobiia bacterium]|nr:TetR/AcrR family transcriptional regulator [Acidimicrobiia bacterium]